MSRTVLTIDGNRTLRDGHPFLVLGVRCSNAAVSDAATDELVANLDAFASYGVNAISVYVMGSRFGDVRGYREDGALDPIYAARLARAIEATDAFGMVVLLGCLYWGNSRAKWESWTQADAEAAVADTARWVAERDWRHVFLDTDNEGMAHAQGVFDDAALIRAAKAAAPEVLVGSNYRGDPPPEADLSIHFANRVADKPYLETEGSPSNIPGGYWGPYSKREGFYGYLNVGVYTPEMRENQIALTREHLARGEGYMLASTWLQAPPPQGPNHRPGGYGTEEDPGVRWWLEEVRASLRPWTAEP